MHPQNSRPAFETSLENSALKTVVRNPTQNSRNEKREVLPAAQWLRVVTGFEAPFGRDGLPTVWG